jgi:hypothetical protein
MKWKLMLGSTILAILSNHVLATVIYHGKLLSHKEWSDSKINGIVKDAPADTDTVTQTMLQLKQLKSKKVLLSQNETGDSIWVSDRVMPATVTLGINELTGKVSTSIENSTATPHTYIITSELCVVPLPLPDSDLSCYKIEDTISLDANGHTLFDKHPVLTYNFSDAYLNYIYYLSTIVKRDGIDTIFSTSSAAEIKITDNQSSLSK